MSKPIIVPKGHSIYIHNRRYSQGDEIPAALSKFVPKDWKESESVGSSQEKDKDKPNRNVT